MYVSSTNDYEKLGNLYKEWTGKDRSLKRNVSNALYLMAVESGNIVGALTYIIIEDPFFDRRWCLVENVYVKPDYRNRGIGGELMRVVETQAAQFECDFIKLTSRKDKGKALYRSLGYEEGASFRKIVEKPVATQELAIKQLK